ncbi:MAG: polysaccharide lyase family 7 protein [Bacteroidota bacterium]
MSALMVLITFGCSEEDILLPEESAGDETAILNSAGAVPTVGKIYYIKNRKSGRYLEVQGASNSNGANLRQGGTSVSASQTHRQWQIISTGGGYVRLKGVDSSKSIEVKNGSNANGANVEQRSYSGVTHQQWEIKSTGDGYYRMKSRDSGKSIGIAGGSTAFGANAESRSWNGGTKFQWLFTEVGSSGGGGGGSCSSAACVISGSSSSFSDDWKLNAFSGTLNIGAGSYGENGANGLTYKDNASTSDNSNWFFDTNGYAAFKCHVGNPSSSGSGNMRSELREMDGNGNEWEWDGTTSTLHKMTYKVQVRQLPSSGKVCFGQIHGSGSFDDVIRVQLEDRNANRSANSGSGSGTYEVIIKGYVTEDQNNEEKTGFMMTMDQEYSVEITMQSKKVIVRMNGTKIFEATNVNSKDNYFKAGAYLQSAQFDKSPQLKRNINNFGEVWIKDINVSH